MRLFVKTARAIAWLLLIGITLLSVCPPQMRPDTPAPHDLAHFAIFAACGFAFGVGYRQALPFVIFALGLFSVGIELVQSLIPGRHARLSDLVIDTIAICLSAALPAVSRMRRSAEGA